jgi:DNA (cytosine-5)-methyltransferase 1
MSKPKYVSVFSGAGGLDIGLERAGMQAVSLCEIEPVFCETLAANQSCQHSDGKEYFSEARILNADISDLSRSDLAGKKRIDLVVGGPPCQAFSSSGRQRSVLDPRGRLINEYLRIIDEIQPRMFLFENVRGLVTARDESGEPGGVIRALLDRFHETGYSVRAGLLNSADYGAFQRRVRCFMIGTKRGTAPLFPEPTHQRTPDMFHKTWRTLSQFLKAHCDEDEDQFVFPTDQLRKQLEPLPNGCGLKSAGKAEATRPGGHWGYRQGTFIADLDLPARTVTGSASQDWIRWNGELRRLTLQEVKQLQGFPSDWEIRGTKTQRFKQIGNAVPSLFGQILGETIKSFLEKYPRTSPKRIGMPQSFAGYIEYTKKDHARNKSSRTVQRHFEERGAKKGVKA